MQDPNPNPNPEDQPEPTAAAKAEHEALTGLPWPHFSLEVSMLRLNTALAADSISKGFHVARLAWSRCLERGTDEGIKAAVEEAILRDFREHNLHGQGLYIARHCFGNLAKAWAILRTDEAEALSAWSEISTIETIARTEA
jgi:hypothetical protein